MLEVTNAPDAKPVTEQAIELSLLIDLEARWENLRATSSLPPDALPTTQNLHDKQKAYEAFSVKLTAYNKKYKPAHVPELLLNKPARLGIWCRSMRKLYISLEHDTRGHCPAHLMEKAHRWADRVADMKGVPHLNRSTPPGSIGAVIQQLEAMGQWCDELGQAAPVTAVPA
jgi:hypothetical protein